MGSLALLAKASGHRVTGCDLNVYPPMSTQLEQAGIELIEGFSADQLQLKPDIFVVGNVVSRGNILMEEILDKGLPYISGPQWLNENILQNKWVLAVAGTHGKTTTTSMLAWVLEYAGMEPGFLIGGVPANFSESARLGKSDFFVIEADEYDTAFFDKRSKFVHYRPRTLVINNLEYDHADIFPDLAAIQRQFHHVVRIVPQHGLVISKHSEAITPVLALGCWSEQQTLNDQYSATGWCVQKQDEAGQQFNVFFEGQAVGSVSWSLTGDHNIQNALSAISAARHVGVTPEISCKALSEFNGVKRRMELLAHIEGVHVYDDFAHHPTAIATTLEGLRAKIGEGENLIAIIEPRSNTMKQGVHKDALLQSIASADFGLWYKGPTVDWELERCVGLVESKKNASFAFLKSSNVYIDIDTIIETVVSMVGEARQSEQAKNSHIVIMSNGGFAGIHQRLIDAFKSSYAEK